MYQNRDQLLLARVYFFADFVISSTQVPSSLRGPTDRYNGEAHRKNSSAGTLQRGAALRLFPFASSFAVLKRIVLVLSPFSYPAARGAACPPGVLVPFP